MAGKPRDPNAPKVKRTLGPKKFYVMLDRTKFADGVDPKSAVTGVYSNPNEALDAGDANPNLTFARVIVSGRKTAAA